MMRQPNPAASGGSVTYWQFDLLALALPVGLLMSGQRRFRYLVGPTAALVAVALVWTGPWDEHLIRAGVWSYGPARVLVLVGSVPVEEYVFVALEVVLLAAWGVRTGRLPSRPVGPPARTPRLPSWLPWAVLTLLGAVLAASGGQVRYLGLLLLWAGPPLALQNAIAGDLLQSRRWDRWVIAAPVVLWLCVADRLAMTNGIWSISPAATTGMTVLNLPVEEALFFALTALLATNGLLLATDATALSRVAQVLSGGAGRHRHPRTKSPLARSG